APSAFLKDGIDSTVTSGENTVSTTLGFPAITGDQDHFLIKVGNERMEVTKIEGNKLTVKRTVPGETPVEHKPNQVLQLASGTGLTLKWNGALDQANAGSVSVENPYNSSIVEQFTDIEQLAGSIGYDTFAFQHGSSFTSIDGGGVAQQDATIDTLDYSNYGSAGAHRPKHHEPPGAAEAGPPPQENLRRVHRPGRGPD